MSISPTQRSLKYLRDQGLTCAIVEKFNMYAGPHGIRQDLFGCIDVLALDQNRGVIGVQSCGQSFAAHRDKLLEERAEEVREWLKTPGCFLELWGWRKVKLKRGGKAMRWRPRLARLTLDTDGKTIIFTEVK